MPADAGRRDPGRLAGRADRQAAARGAVRAWTLTRHRRRRPRCSSCAPTPERRTRAAAALPRPCQALRHQCHAKRTAVSRNDREPASIAIGPLVAQRHGTCVEQHPQPLGCACTEIGLARAARRMGLGRIDVGDPHLLARDPDRVAVDHAIGAAAVVADRSVAAGARRPAHGGRGGVEAERPAQRRPRARGEDRGSHRRALPPRASPRRCQPRPSPRQIATDPA